jgi:hypothetical protein
MLASPAHQSTVRRLPIAAGADRPLAPRRLSSRPCDLRPAAF